MDWFVLRQILLNCKVGTLLKLFDHFNKQCFKSKLNYFIDDGLNMGHKLTGIGHLKKISFSLFQQGFF